MNKKELTYEELVEAVIEGRKEIDKLGEEMHEPNVTAEKKNELYLKVQKLVGEVETNPDSYVNILREYRNQKNTK